MQGCVGANASGDVCYDQTGQISETIPSGISVDRRENLLVVCLMCL